MSSDEKDGSNLYGESSSTEPCGTDRDVVLNDVSRLSANDKLPSAFVPESPSRQKVDGSMSIHSEGLKHLDLAADSTCLNTEPSSGFMLISVKHLSKVKRMNYRTRSVSSLSTHALDGRNVLLDRNNLVYSSREDSSPTTSSPLCEEEGPDDFHGSGSIEAEEFEDDDEVDESEGANEDDSTTIVVGTAGKLISKDTGTQKVVGSVEHPQILNTTRPSQVNSSTQTVSRPETPISHWAQCDSSFVFPPNHCRVSPKIPQTLPSGFSLSACNRHFEFFGCGAQQPRAINPCEVLRYNSVVSSHGNQHPLPSLITPHIQTNSSHYQSELDTNSPAPNPSVQTAPVSGHVSPSTHPTIPSTTETLAVPGLTPLYPPHPSTASMYHDSASSISLVTAAAVAAAANTAESGYPASDGATGTFNWPGQPGVVRPSLVHSPYDLPLSNAQPHHAFPGLPLTCPLHPHSASSSEVRSAQIITTTESDQLTADVVAINAATLPSLQPASRFRKARIHETVEQWCHGRLSVHDCRLKVVPDWVSDLQKKAPVLDREIVNALAQRVNCFSCSEQKALDRTGLQQTTGLSSLKGADAHVHPASSQSKIEDGHHIRRVLSRCPPRNNLFSFWDGGARVYCRLPKSTRMCIHTGLSESPIDLPPQPEENGMEALTGEEESIEICTGPADSSTKVAADSTSGLHDEGQTGVAPIPDSLSSAPVIFLPANNADPATAYLRRQQFNAEGHMTYLSTQQDSLLKAGDSPSADELSLPLSDVAQSSPGSTDYANQSLHHEAPSFQVTRTVTQQFSSGNSREQEPQVFLVRKRSVLEAMPVMVPPTSPTYIDGGAGEPYPPGLVNEKHVGLPPGTMVNGIGMADAPPVYPKIQRIMNGDYMNKMPTEACASGGYHNVMSHFVSNGPTDPRSESIKPTSSLPSPTASLRSTVPYSHCSDAPALRCEPVPPGHVLVNGEVGLPHLSPSSLPPDQSSHRTNFKTSLNPVCMSNSLMTVLPIKPNLNNGLDRDYNRSTKLSAVLSTRLEARINESIDTIRTGIVNTVRDELVSAYSEANDLLTEVNRLKEEVTRLRGYQAAFFAVRPYVSPELWEHINAQHVLIRLQSTPSLIPTNSSTLAPATLAPSIKPNSPQHAD